MPSLKFGHLIEAIQTLIEDRTSVDVRVRCKDHLPSDGLGAHKLILAAASPMFLKDILSALANAEDELLCIHLPDYTADEVGPVMSLLYYGEIWITESYAQVCQSILQDLKIAVELDFNDVIKKEVKIKVEPADEDADEESIITTPGEPELEQIKAKVSCGEPGCSYVTSSLSSLQSHRLIHHRRKSRLILDRTCPACKAIMETPKELRNHAIESHAEIDDKIAHCILDSSCTWTRHLSKDDLGQKFIQHLSVEHNVLEDVPNLEVLRCDFPGCDYETSKPYNLAQHIRTHNDERQHTCPICNQGFRASSHLKNHIKAIHTKERNFQCPKCPRFFATSWNLKIHLKNKHGKLKDYACKYCLEHFITPQALAGHIRSGHRSENVKKAKISIICEVCGQEKATEKGHKCEAKGDDAKQCHLCQKTMKAKALKNHLLYHRRKEVTTNNCQYCNKSFTCHASLKKHNLIHENKKPFKCSTCSKTFRAKSSLQVHQRTHSGERFPCKTCSQKFISVGYLNQHVKKCKAKKKVVNSPAGDNDIYILGR